MRIDYTKIAEAERTLFEAVQKIRFIDSPLPGELWGAVEDLEKVKELLRAFLAGDNLLPDEENL